MSCAGRRGRTAGGCPDQNGGRTCTIKSVTTRRSFISAIGTAAASIGRTRFDLSTIPNFCSHEHWGSIDSIGTFPGGYRADIEQGATPVKATRLFDLLVDPYLRGVLLSSGIDRNALTRREGWEGFSALRSVLQDHQFNGIHQCTRRGILALYGFDTSLLNPAALVRLEDQIERNYQAPFDWYRKAMVKANFSGLIRPVHPEFYQRKQSAESSQAEASFTRTVMRIDPFLDFAALGPERRRNMSDLAGVEPADPKSWRVFLHYWFEQAQRNRAVGIKQLQAYRRDLAFQSQSDEGVDWKGGASPEVLRRFQDWIMHECCKQADERGWAHQIHVGTHNLPNSSPLPLLALARRYPRMKVVMIHCWPFLEEAGTLARQSANMYIDTCWQPILNPEFFRSAIKQWWNYVPSNKVTCGHDATTIEMAVGSSLFTREILSEVLQEQARRLGSVPEELIRSARNMLHDNALRIYGLDPAAGTR